MTELSDFGNGATEATEKTDLFSWCLCLGGGERQAADRRELVGTRGGVHDRCSIGERPRLV